MKYMILMYGSQRDYDAMAGQASAESPAWTGEQLAGMGAFMEGLAKELADSGELVETRGLGAPVHTRRLGSRDGQTVITDGPYAETQEVLAGYWVVECDGLDRATEIAARLDKCPAPPEVAARAYADIRPIMDGRSELEL